MCVQVHTHVEVSGLHWGSLLVAFRGSLWGTDPHLLACLSAVMLQRRPSQVPHGANFLPVGLGLELGLGGEGLSCRHDDFWDDLPGGEASSHPGLEESQYLCVNQRQRRGGGGGGRHRGWWWWWWWEWGGVRGGPACPGYGSLCLG